MEVLIGIYMTSTMCLKKRHLIASTTMVFPNLTGGGTCGA